MPFFLSMRDTDSTEKMDRPDCDHTELWNTYRQFSTINALLSQWRKIYRSRLRPYLQSKTHSHILDIGFGGGDIPIKLAQWANQDNLRLSVTAIDPDERAFNFAQQIASPNNVKFLHCSAAELLASNRNYDFVISNHLLHHLSPDELPKVLSEAKALSNHAIIFNDIKRSDIGYALFNVLARPTFRSSFITHDGLTSIKKSYTPAELQQTVPKGWQVQTLFPFRLLLTYHHNG
ncbi:class I SAM-dependent methyltransferase [Fodinibius salsisoli]|uniref:Methyltransferase domain-containing protein n=1 Tax=Fodinibius salsisoli TaxID=2820877 RepID=A0ABT3PNK4_9BACT|nr:class I SAM-dependent methyltransferase [Fodinibius salsisoli]MCW9707443.1 methyltransferase domain-containing protein [Fodinibius salsisoli]